MMKKSQILAALALAMALGVVAPVAGAYAMVDEIRDDQGRITTHGKASCREARSAANTITNHTHYKNLKAFFDVAKAVKNDTTVYQNGHTVTTTVAGDFSDLVTAFAADYRALPAASASTQAADVIRNYPAALNGGVKHLGDILNKLSTIYQYDEYKAIYDAINEENNGDGSFSKFEAAIRAFDTKYNDEFHNIAITMYGAPDYQRLYTDAKAGNAPFNAAPYTTFATLAAHANAGQKLYDAYMNAYTSLDNAWKVLDRAGQIAPAGKVAHNGDGTAANTGVSLDNNAFIGINNMVSLVYAVLGGTTVEFGDDAAIRVEPTRVYRGNDWNTLLAHGTGSLYQLTSCDINNADETEVEYQRLAETAKAFGRAIYRDVATYQRVNAFAHELIKGGNITAGDPTNDPNPATPDPTDSLDAPLSGVLGSAEGSATTISIVAGLATALTALGAGVVAYRNARREK